MARNELFKIWYRSVTKSDGRVWCESSSLFEVIEMSRGYDCTFHTLTQVLITGDWEEMSKKEMKNHGITK